MGNQNSSNIFITPLPQELALSLRGQPHQKKDINYGKHFKIVKNKQDSKLFAIKIDEFSEKDDYCKHIYDLKLRKSSLMKLDSFVSVEGIYVNDDNLYCSRNLTVYSQYRYYSNSLRTYIKKIKNDYIKTFDVDEVLYVIYQVVDTLKKLEKYNIFHGNIRPETILIDGNQMVKLTDSYFMLKESSYQRYLFGKYEEFYLCPSMLKQLKMLKIDPKINYEKSNVFCLGLSILELLTLCEINQIYLMAQFTILKSKLDQLIYKAKNKYNDKIGFLLQNMLKLKKRERYGYDQILTYFHEIKFEKIKNLQEKDDNLIPAKENYYQKLNKTGGFSACETTDESKFFNALKE